MSSNKRAKELLIQRYGEIDFLDQLKVKIPECKTYKSKGQRKRMQQLTYHHIFEKQFGGKSTVENGALLTEEHHIWLHKQPPEVKSKLNMAFQELKRRKDQELGIEYVDINEIPFELNVCDLEIDSKGKLRVYNRAKVKEQMRKLVIEELEKE